MYTLSSLSKRLPPSRSNRRFHSRQSAVPLLNVFPLPYPARSLCSPESRPMLKLSTTEPRPMLSSALSTPESGQHTLSISCPRSMDSSEAGPSTLDEPSSGMELVANDGEQTNVDDKILGNELHDENELVEKCFPSREDLVKHVKKFAIAQGFAASIKRSSSRDKYVILGCDKGGTYRNSRNMKDDERKKNSSSRLVNCPFEVRGKQNVDGSWKLTLKDLEHNHERPNVLIGHRSVRRFSEEERKKIKEMKSNNIPPRQVLATLKKENPNLAATSRDLYNMIQKLRKEEKAEEGLLGERSMDSSEAGPSTLDEPSSGMELVETDGEQRYVCDEILGNDLHDEIELVENELHDEIELVEKRFPSREDLVKHVKKFVIAQGFAASIKRSCNRDKSVILGCDRGGTYRNSRKMKDDERKKNASSRLVNCPFKVKGKQNVDGSWYLYIKNLEHNHERPNVSVGHPTARRFTEEEKKKIKEMKINKIPPRQILTTLRKENPNLEVKSRDLYNMIHKLRKEEKKARGHLGARLKKAAEAKKEEKK